MRSQFADYPEARASLDQVEAHDNSINAAAEVIASQSTDTRSPTLLESDPNFFNKATEQARDVICSKYTDDVLEIFKELRQFIPFTGSIAALIAIKVVKIGVENFCESSKAC
ncbi:MAG: hypothetical protein ACHBN1_37590 [Heteroscytonema crispum UTEX LB 1556]